MKPIFVFTVLAAMALGATAAPNACDSCKSMVQTFIDASKDQMKMAQLKISLSMMCAGTSHQSDCHKTLDKLDYIAFKLAPYLADTSAVCSKLQMCGESQFSPLARLAMLYLKKSESIVANDNMMKQQVCDECQASSSQLGQLFGDEFTSYAVKSTIQRFACRSAGKAQKACNIFVSSVIPSMMTEMRDMFTEKQTMCSNMGLCSSTKSVSRQTVQRPIGELMKSMGIVKTSQGEELMSCFECTLSMDTLLEEFIDKRQATADDIQKAVCAKVVGAWTDGCNDFVHMYMSTVLFLTYNQFDGKGICTMMHTCEKKDSALLTIPQMEKVELGCANCRNVETFFHQNHQELASHAVEGIYNNLCQKLPTAFGAMCESMAIRMSRVFFTRAAELAGSGAMCSQMC
ncbi:CBN-SPP-8 protein [Caenorhabditis brenneri]|uniref:CBN-SPP-8 protein n=1 Tax=Caenorhabditis brenneri TaxID=135651 RepID=G0P9W7_CAEBE|nr:CBN-SPP-8 protein [Caenorhabditis brenneri]